MLAFPPLLEVIWLLVWCVALTLLKLHLATSHILGLPANLQPAIGASKKYSLRLMLKILTFLLMVCSSTGPSWWTRVCDSRMRHIILFAWIFFVENTNCQWPSSCHLHELPWLAFGWRRLQRQERMASFAHGHALASHFACFFYGTNWAVFERVYFNGDKAMHLIR